MKFIIPEDAKPDDTLSPLIFVEDEDGKRIRLPNPRSFQTTSPREESAMVGNDIVSRQLEPARATVKFEGGEITLDLPRRGWSR